MKPVTRYAVYLPCNREGEFEFLCSTQTHLTESKEDAIQEAKNHVADLFEDEIEELGKPVIYELQMTVIEY